MGLWSLGLWPVTQASLHLGNALHNSFPTANWEAKVYVGNRIPELLQKVATLMG